MAVGVLMPKAGISVESCIITKWRVQPGDTVKEGDILFDYETDKASFECESTAAGTLLEQFYGDGDEVPVLVNVCAVGNTGEDVSALRGGDAPAAPAEEAPKIQENTETTDTVSITTVVMDRVPAQEGTKASPRARRLAKLQNVELAGASGSGPYGRVIERDVRELAARGPAAQAAPAASAPAAAPAGEGPAYTDTVFSGIRKAISKSMTASLSSIPQLTHSFSFDATELLDLRKKLKASGEETGLPNITLNDMVLFAVSRLLKKYPALNAHMLDGNTLRTFRDVNLGMAVDTPRGLLVPVIKNADRKSLAQIATEAKALAKQAQEGTLSPDDMSGGTFTISNLGALNVEHFTPVINPPQTGILGVNTITQRPREVDGEIKLYSCMGVSLTYDHRAIDGAPASRFGSELCRSLERFSLLLMQ